MSPEQWAELNRVPLVVEGETVRATALASARAVVDEVLADDAVAR